MNPFKLFFLSFLALGFTALAMEQHNNIISAAHAGNIEAVQAFLDAGADVNQADRCCFSYGWTALTWATQEGYQTICELLIANSANVNQANKDDGSTALILAADKGYQTICELLIAKGADVNQANIHGKTALMAAAYQGCQPICKLLIANGADVNQVNEYSRTALMLAAYEGHQSICELLIANGANVNQARVSGETALIEAAKNGRQPICEMLINRMLKIPSDAQRDRLYTFLMCMEKIGFDWVVINQCKPHLLKAIEEENETEPKGSIALQEIEKIKNENMKQALIKKYWPEKTNNSL